MAWGIGNTGTKRSRTRSLGRLARFTRPKTRFWHLPENINANGGSDMNATYAPLDYTMFYLDELLPDGATGEQFEAWLDLILGGIEIESARD